MIETANSASSTDWLLLAAASFEAYRFLDSQLRVHALLRDYAVLGCASVLLLEPSEIDKEVFDYSMVRLAVHELDVPRSPSRTWAFLSLHLSLPVHQGMLPNVIRGCLHSILTSS